MTGQRSQCALVAARHRSMTTLYSDGVYLQCARKPGLATPIAGDHVRWLAREGQAGLITQILKRKNILTRPTRGGASRAIAANLDYILLVFAATPAHSALTIDRSLAR